MMKLKNLLFATMVACAFSSCSKDEGTMSVPTPGTNEGEPATLSIQVASPIGVRSGAVTGAKDNNINNLVVYVFNAADGKLQATGVAGANGTANTDKTELTQISVSAGEKKIVVLANVTAKVYANLAALQADLLTFAEVEGNLSMNSKIYTSTIQPNVTNYLGFDKTDGKVLDASPVKLFRNVAKINLQSIKLLASEGENTYTDATFKVTNVFLLHAPQSSRVIGIGEDMWGATESIADAATWLGGATTTDYTKWTTIMEDWAGKNPGKSPKKNYVGLEVAPKDYKYDVNAVFATGKTWGNVLNEKQGGATLSNKEGSLDYFYSYENLQANLHTLLVVEGVFSYGPTTDRVELTRYYSVSVGHDGVTAEKQTLEGVDRPGKGVMRNLQYNINLIVKGPGYLTPFGPDGGGSAGDNDTFLDVKVDVVDFGTVNQNQDIE